METKQLTNEPVKLKQVFQKLKNLRETSNYGYDLSDNEEYIQHAEIVQAIGNTLMAKEFREFEIDKHNQKILRFLLLYFNHCKEAESIFPDENYKIHKQIMLVGNIGVGKTMLMQIFSLYLRITNNPNAFFNVSVTEMINYYKVNNHLDKYTFNELSGERKFTGNPVNLCLNDIGLSTHLHFGVDTKVLIDDFLYSRYELFINHGRMAHLTSNLSVPEIKQSFDYRITDRLKSYNIIDLNGESRRK
jgi:DNA replication protein DnaC